MKDYSDHSMYSNVLLNFYKKDISVLTFVLTDKIGKRRKSITPQ